MSENALETLVDELYKNGIAVEGYELTGRASGEPKKVLRTVFELDFSEHDKVFEDKIAKLEKENKALNSYLVQREQDSTDMIMKLKQEKSDKNEKIAELACENESLKQRIAELESKETETLDEVPDSITIDGYKCKIIKTERGLYISRDEIYSIIDKEKEPLKQKCKKLEDRHQSDCIEINRLNTTIDVLIHKVEYLRQFAGLE